MLQILKQRTCGIQIFTVTSVFVFWIEIKDSSGIQKQISKNAKMAKCSPDQPYRSNRSIFSGKSSGKAALSAHQQELTQAGNNNGGKGTRRCTLRLAYVIQHGSITGASIQLGAVKEYDLAGMAAASVFCKKIIAPSKRRKQSIFIDTFRYFSTVIDTYRRFWRN